MNKLTPNEKETIANIVESQKSLGFVSKAMEYYSETMTLDETKYIKVNLPNTTAKFKSGNGEGIWACPVSHTDEEILTNGKAGDTCDVYALNDCINYPIACASIIRVKITSDTTRPILDYDWMDNIVKTSSNGERSLADILQKD